MSLDAEVVCRTLNNHTRQFYDLIEIFRIGGYAPNTNYLFLGARIAPIAPSRSWLTLCRRLRRPRALQRRDHIPPDVLEAAVPRPRPADQGQPRIARGHPGPSVRQAAAAAAAAAAASVLAERRTHRAPQTYGFYTECVRKYGSSHVWTYFTDMFDFLTLSVVIDNNIFCVHGGGCVSARVPCPRTLTAPFQGCRRPYIR